MPCHRILIVEVSTRAWRFCILAKAPRSVHMIIPFRAVPGNRHLERVAQAALALPQLRQ